MSNIWHEIKEEAEELKFKDSSMKREWMDQKFKEEIAKLGQTLVDSLNTMGCTDIAVEGLFEGIQNTHRFLQNEFWMVMLKVIEKYGNSEFFDQRNEYAVNICKRLSKEIK